MELVLSRLPWSRRSHKPTASAVAVDRRAPIGHQHEKEPSPQLGLELGLPVYGDAAKLHKIFGGYCGVKFPREFRFLPCHLVKKRVQFLTRRV